MRTSPARIAGTLAAVVALVAGVAAFRLEPDDVTRVSSAVSGLWVPVTSTGEVVHVDGASGRVTARVPVADPGARLELAERDEGLVVVDRTTGRVSMVDPAFQEVAADLALATPIGDGEIDIATSSIAAAIGDEVATVDLALDAAERVQVSGPVSSLAVDGTAVLVEDGDRAWRVDAGSTDELGPAEGRFARVGDRAVVIAQNAVRSTGGEELACLRRPVVDPDHVIGSDDGVVAIVDGPWVHVASLDTGECAAVFLGDDVGPLGRPAIALDRVFVPEPSASRVLVVEPDQGTVTPLTVPSVEGPPDLQVRSRGDIVVAYDTTFPIAAVLDRTSVRRLVDLSASDQAFRVALDETAGSDGGAPEVAVEGAVEFAEDELDAAALAALRTADAPADAPETDDLVANFAFSASTVPVGVEVRFVDDSSGEPETWRWDFGDGTGAEGPEVRKAWAEPGDYRVTLRVTRGTEESSVSLPIVVVPADSTPPPAADFVASSTVVEVGATVAFEDRSAGDVSQWRWDFGDGTSASGRSVRHAWTAPGTYTVRLTVANDRGVDDASLEVVVTERLRAPVPVVEVSTTTPVAGAGVRFEARSSTDPARFRWDFGDGTTSSGPSVTHVFVDEGRYRVVLTAQNGAGSAQETVVIDVSEAVVAPQAVISPPPSVIEVGETVTLNSLSTNRPRSESWDLGDGSTATGRSVVHTWDTPGVYTIVLTATNDAGSDTDTIDIEVVAQLPPPVARFGSYDPAPWVGTETVFIDDSLHATGYLWDFGDGLTSTVPVPAHAFSTPGPKTVTLTVTNRNGSDTTAVTVTPRLRPVADFAVSSTGSEVGEVISFTDRSLNAVSWRWSFGDGTSSTVRNPTHGYTAPGSYPVTLEVTTAAGDVDTSDPVTIVVDPAGPRLASVVLVPDNRASVVVGTTVTFAANPAASSGPIDEYQFDFGDGAVVTSLTGQASHAYGVAGTYTVRARGRGPLGEWSPWVSRSTSVVNPQPPSITSLVANPSPTTVGAATTFAASATGAVASWEWDFTGGGSAYSPGPATVSHTFGSAGTYTVWVRAIGPAPTSFTATRSITVEVRPAPAPATPTASPGTSVLTNTTVSFTTVDTAGRSGLTWTWTVSDPDPSSTSGGPSMSRLFTVPGTYTVTATARDDLGIQGSASVIVTVTDPAPSIEAGFGFTVNGLDVTFTDQSSGPPITSWTWEFGDGTTSTLQNPVHTYAAAGVYPVRLTVTGPGSQVDSAIRDVTVS